MWSSIVGEVRTKESRKAAYLRDPSRGYCHSKMEYPPVAEVRGMMIICRLRPKASKLQPSVAGSTVPSEVARASGRQRWDTA
jgi:hypothetical protein